MKDQKKALLIIDMQNDVLKKLVTTGAAVIPSIKKVLNAFREEKLPIFHIVREHRKNGVDVERFRTKIFNEKPFLVIGSEGAEVVSELKPLEEEYVISKQRFSGFFQTELLMILMRLGIERLIVCGVQTPNCVRCTVTDAMAYDFDVTILEDASAAQTQEVHQANLFDMKNMGAQIATIEAFLSGVVV